MQNRNCGTLWFLKNNAFTPALDLKSNETYTIGTNSKDNIRLKVQTFVPESSILKVDKYGFVKFRSNDITDCQINDKLFQGTKYLIPGDLVNLMGKMFKYEASTLSNEHIEILQNENKRHFKQEKLKMKEKIKNKRHTSIVKKSVQVPKTSAPNSCHTMYSFNFKEEIIRDHPVTPSRSSVHKSRFRKSFRTPRSARKAKENYSYLQYRKISLNFENSKIDRNIDAIHSSDEDRPPDLTPLATASYSGDNLSYVQDNGRLTQEFIEDNHKNNLSSDISIEMGNVGTYTDDNIEDSVFNDRPPDLTPLVPTSYSGDNLSYVQDNDTLQQEFIEDNCKSNLSSDTSIEIENVVAYADDNIEDSVFNEDRPPDLTPLATASYSGDNLSYVRDNGRLTHEFIEDNHKNNLFSDISIEMGNVVTYTDDNIEDSVFNEDRPPDLTPLATASYSGDNLSYVQDNGRLTHEFIEDNHKNNLSSDTSIEMENVVTYTGDNIEGSVFIQETLQNEEDKLEVDKLSESVTKEILKETQDNTKSFEGTPFNARVTRRSTYAETPNVKKFTFSDLKTSKNDKENFVSPIKRTETPTRKSILKKTPAVNREIKNSAAGSLKFTTELTPVRNLNMMKIAPSSDKRETVISKDKTISDKRSKSILVTQKELASIEQCSDVLKCSASDRINTLNGNSTAKKLNKSGLITRTPTGRNSENLKTPRSTRKCILSADDDTIANYPNENTSSTRSSRITCNTPQIEDEFGRISEINSLKSSTPSNLSILKNEAFVTLRRSARRTRSVSYNPAIEETKDDVLYDSEFSIGSSSGHYDSDRDVDKEEAHGLSGIKLLDTSLKNTPEKLGLNRNSESLKGDLRQDDDKKGSLRNSTLTSRDTVSYHSLFNQENASNVSDLNTTRSSSFSYESFTSKKSIEISPNRTRSIKNSLKESYRGSRYEVKNLTSRESIDISPNEAKSIKNTLEVNRGLKRSRSEIESPKNVKKLKMSTNVSGVEGMLTLNSGESLKNDLTDVEGIKDLLNTPGKSRRSLNELSDYKGIKDLLNSSNKPQKTPKNDLTDVRSIKKLMATPKSQKSPRNDLRDAKGIKQLLETPKVQKSPQNDLRNIVGVKKLMATPKYQKSPTNDLRNVGGVKRLMVTPKIQKSPKNDLTDVAGVKKAFATPKVQASPRNDLTNVAGVKKIMATPKAQKSPKNDLVNIVGVKKMFATPKQRNSPRNDLTNVAGVKKMMATPKAQKSPENDLSNVAGVKKILKTPKHQKSPKNDLSDIAGVKKLLATPKTQKSPRNDLTDVRGVKKIIATPKIQKSPLNDLTNIKGVKKMMATPKAQKSPENDLSNVAGVKKILKTPKYQKSPQNDLSNIAGVKNLLATPKMQKSPRNDLTDVKGVKKIIATPKIQKSPNNDLSKVSAVKKIFATPKVPKTPENSYDNVRDVKTFATPKGRDSPKKLMKTPKPQKDPENDYRNVTGVKKLFATPKIQNPPKNSLDDLTGVKQLYNTPKQKKSDLNDIRGVKDLFHLLEKKQEDEEIDYEGLKEMFQSNDVLRSNEDMDPFDVLVNRHSIRTYKAKSVSPNIKNLERTVQMEDIPSSVTEWVEDQSKRVANEEMASNLLVTPNKKATRSTVRKNVENSTLEEPKHSTRQTRRNKIQAITAEEESNGHDKIESGLNKNTRKGNQKQANNKDNKKEPIEGKVSKSREDIEEVNDRPKRRVVKTRNNQRSDAIKRLKNDVDEVSESDEDDTVIKRPQRGNREKKKQENLSKKKPVKNDESEENDVKEISENDEDNDTSTKRPQRGNRGRKTYENQPKKESKKNDESEKLENFKDPSESEEDTIAKRLQRINRRRDKHENLSKKKSIKNDDGDENEDTKKISESDEDDASIKRLQRENRERNKHEDLSKKELKKNNKTEEYEDVKKINESNEDEDTSVKRPQRENRGRKKHDNLSKKKQMKNDEGDENDDVKKISESDEDEETTVKRSQRGHREKKKPENLPKKTPSKNDKSDENDVKKISESDEDQDTRVKRPQRGHREKNKQETLSKKKPSKNDEGEENKDAKEIKESDEDSDTSVKRPQRQNRGRKKQENLPKKELKNDEREENEDVKKIRESDEDSDSTIKRSQKKNRERKKQENLPKKEPTDIDEGGRTARRRHKQSNEENNEVLANKLEINNKNKKVKKLNGEVKSGEGNGEEDYTSTKRPQTRHNRNRKENKENDNTSERDDESVISTRSRTRRQDIKEKTNLNELDAISSSSNNSKGKINEAKRSKRTASKRTREEDVSPNDSASNKDENENQSSRTLRRRSDRHAPLPKSLEEYEVDLGRKSKIEEDLKRKQRSKRGASKVPTDSDEGSQIRKSKRARK